MNAPTYTKMLYIGLPLSGYEATRLLGSILSDEERKNVIRFENDDAEAKFLAEVAAADGEEDHSVYSFHEILLNHYIKDKTHLSLHYLDKGVYILGYELPEIRQNLWGPMNTVEESLVLILSRKVDWVNEAKWIGMDLSKVLIAHMEDKSEVVHYAEPVLVSW